MNNPKILPTIVFTREKKKKARKEFVVVIYEILSSKYQKFLPTLAHLRANANYLSSLTFVIIKRKIVFSFIQHICWNLHSTSLIENTWEPAFHPLKACWKLHFTRCKHVGTCTSLITSVPGPALHSLKAFNTRWNLHFTLCKHTIVQPVHAEIPEYPGIDILQTMRIA